MTDKTHNIHATTDQLDALGEAAIAGGRAARAGEKADTGMFDLYKAIGFETEAMRWRVWCGHVAGYLHLSGDDRLERAAVILRKKKPGSKGDASACRTALQEKAYAGARTKASRIRKAAGVEAFDKRGGDQTSPDDKASDGDEEKTTRAPQTGSNAPDEKTKVKGEAATMVPAMASHKAMAAFLLNLVNKNHFAMTGPEGKELERAVAAYSAKHSAPDH